MLTQGPGLFNFPVSASKQVHKKPGGSSSRTADQNWPKGCSLPENVTFILFTGGIWLGISQWVVSNGIVHYLSFLSFITLLTFVVFLFMTIIMIIIMFCLISILKLFLCKPLGFTFFFPQFSSPSAQDGRDWDSGCILLSCWLRLNHNTHK